MRHRTFFKTVLLSVMGLVCITAYADDRTTIKIKQVNPTTRSIVGDIPEASVRNDILTVSFDGQGLYSLYIEDNFGVSVYSSALPANGMEYDYDLSGIGEGLFRLVISGPSGEYEGHFTIN